jgi:hypothetical protein
MATPAPDEASSQVASRLGRLESELDSLRPSLLQRLERIEQAVQSLSVKKPPTRFGRFVAWMGAELPKLITGLVVIAVAFGIKDSVDLSIRQRQLDLSFAKEMQSLLKDMGAKGAERATIEANAIVIASYGEAALAPLMNELRQSELRAEGAATGLSALALTVPKAVCDALPRILENRARQFDWQAQLRVVRILGETECRSAEKALLKYRSVVAAAEKGDTVAFKRIVSELPQAPTADYPVLLKAIDESLEMLKR